MAHAVTTALLLALASAGVADAGRAAPKGTAVATTPPPASLIKAMPPKVTDHAKLSAASALKATALNRTLLASPPVAATAAVRNNTRAPVSGFVTRANSTSLVFSLNDAPFYVTGANQCASRARATAAAAAGGGRPHSGAPSWRRRAESDRSPDTRRAGRPDAPRAIARARVPSALPRTSRLGRDGRRRARARAVSSSRIEGTAESARARPISRGSPCLHMPQPTLTPAGRCAQTR
jgi:hypothetical protein